MNGSSNEISRNTGHEHASLVFANGGKNAPPIQHQALPTRQIQVTNEVIVHRRTHTLLSYAVQADPKRFAIARHLSSHPCFHPRRWSVVSSHEATRHHAVFCRAWKEAAKDAATSTAC